MNQREREQEQSYLDRVEAFLDAEILRLTELSKSSFASVKKQGSKFNQDNPAGGMYAGMELTELHYEMEREMKSAETAKDDIWFYRRLKSAPYFARVDFVPDRTGRLQNIYIGLRTLQDPESYETLVSDWRAPVSSLFYDDFEGTRASFEAPAGRIDGELVLKRQFKFEDGKLKFFADSSVKIDDEILTEALSSGATDKLKVIVNSIQKEQNAAIRYSADRNLLVIGPAGSGKTSVGFHRLAYLLYARRQELSSGEIVMFSNSDIFTSYVADIIPELGEMPINYASFYSIFASELPGRPISDYYALGDAILSGDGERLETAKLKYSADFLGYVEKCASNSTRPFSELCLFEDVILSKEELKRRFESDTEDSLLLRSERLTAFAKIKIEEYFNENARAIYERLDRESAIDENTATLVKLKKRELRMSSAQMIKDAVLPDPVSVYSHALEAYIKEKKILPQLSKKALEAIRFGTLDFEDALCVLLIKFIMGTAEVRSGVKHVLIDEAQDLCPLQHRLVRKMFPHARFTLLADSRQAILPAINSVDLEALSKDYGADTYDLNKSYRSTQQINTFALSLLPNQNAYEIFERGGDEVQQKKVKELVSEVASETKNNLAFSPSVCIITRTVREARALYNELTGTYGLALKLCDNRSSELGDGAIVMPLVFTKGLEFDSVIVAETNGSFSGDKNKSELYMAVTRALHRLTVFFSAAD